MEQLENGLLITLTIVLVALGQWWGVVALWLWLIWTRWK
jgi:hypothetical protein